MCFVSDETACQRRESAPLQNQQCRCSRVHKLAEKLGLNSERPECNLFEQSGGRYSASPPIESFHWANVTTDSVHRAPDVTSGEVFRGVYVPIREFRSRIFDQIRVMWAATNGEHLQSDGSVAARLSSSPGPQVGDGESGEIFYDSIGQHHKRSGGGGSPFTGIRRRQAGALLRDSSLLANR